MIGIKKAKGFTLIEMILVIAILAAIATIAIPRVTYSRRQAEIAACSASKSIINSQIELFYMDTGEFPHNVTFWNTSSAPTTNLLYDYLPDGVPNCPLGAGWVYNTTTHHINAHSH